MNRLDMDASVGVKCEYQIQIAWGNWLPHPLLLWYRSYANNSLHLPIPPSQNLYIDNMLFNVIGIPRQNSFNKARNNIFERLKKT